MDGVDTEVLVAGLRDVTVKYLCKIIPVERRCNPSYSVVTTAIVPSTMIISASLLLSTSSSIVCAYHNDPGLED